MATTRIAAIYPATPSQQGFVLGALSRPESSVFLEQTTLCLGGELDIARLRALWARAVRHHAILRTGFASNVSDAPRQVVLIDVEAAIEFVDASDLPVKAQDAQLEEILRAHRAAGFDLRKPPLVRLAVQRRTAVSHMVVWTHHHAVLDGYSQAQLLGELLTDYNRVDLAESSAGAGKSFGDYATWLSGLDREEDIAFWRGQLEDYEPGVSVVAARGSEGVTSGRASDASAVGRSSPGSLDVGEVFGSRVISLSPELDAGVRQLCVRHGLSTGAVLIGVWSLVAAAFRRTTDTAVGVTISGRSAECDGCERVVGPFVNTLPHRVLVDGAREVVSWLLDTQSSLATLSQYAHCSTGEIRRWLRTPGDRALFDTVMAMAVFDEYAQDPPGVRALHIVPGTTRGHGGRTLHAVSLTVERVSGLTIRLVHDRGRVSDAAAGSLLWALEIGLEIATTRPGARVDELTDAIERELPVYEVAAPSEDGRAADPASLEAAVAAVFADVLGRRTVALDADFVSMGGHSLLAIELLASLRQRLHVDMTLQQLFEAGTPLGVARVVRTLTGAPLPEAEFVSPSSSFPLALTRQVEDGSPFDLSDMQAAYWAGRQSTFDLSGVDSHCYIELDVEALDLDRLQAVVQVVIARHGMLRATVGEDGTQVVQERVPFYEIAVTDLSAAGDGAELGREVAAQGGAAGRVSGGATAEVGGAGAGYGAVVERVLAAMRGRLSCARRDPGVWPLFSIEAARLPGGVTRLFISIDLLIGDARSWEILSEELIGLYRDPLKELVPLAITYRDYVAAVQALKTTPGYARAREYWRSRLDTLPAPPQLPRVERAQPADARFVRRPMRLDRRMAERLRECAADFGVTPSVLLLQVFADVLSRFGNSDDCLINLTISNRLPMLPGIDGLVGNCTSLSLTAVSCGAPTFAERARRTQQQLWSDLDHRLYSGLEVLRDLRERDRSPLHAQAPVVFTSTLGPGPACGDRGEPAPGTVPYAIGQTPQVILDFQTYEVGAEVAIVWDSVDAVFPAGLIDAMFEAHQRALHTLLTTRVMPAIVTAPDRPALEPSPFLGGTARLFDPILARAAEAPQAVAIVAGGRAVSYGEMLGRARAVAAAIGTIPHGSIVAVVMEKGWEPVVGVLGALLAGAAFVPMDPSWPAARIASLLQAVEATVALTQARVRGRVTLPAGVRAIDVDSIDADGVGAAGVGAGRTTEVDSAEASIGAAAGVAGAASARGVDSAFAATSAADIAYVIFTSGSTGVPKGVVMQHQAVLNTVIDINSRFGVGLDDRVLAISPLVFDLSMYDIFGVLAAGGTIVMPMPDDVQDPSRLAALIEAERVTVWNSVPVLMDLLVGAPGASHQLQSLRLCMLSGDWIPVSLPGAVRRCAPGANVVSLGGATEGAIWSILYEIGEVPDTWTSIPYGHSMVGQDVRVLDRHFLPSPVWVPGEIYIGGNGLALGYWNDPVRTDAQFVRDPHTHQLLFKTGDWGRLRPDGEIEFLGRRDAQVKVNGHRVELQEIEAAMRACAGVESAAVIAVGQGADRRLAGFVCGAVEGQVVRSFVQSRLPAYMVPPSIRVIATLPLSPTGKVDRGALTRLAEAGLEESGVQERRASIDDDLRAIVASALGSEGVAIDPEADLLAAGLTSVRTIRMMNAIEKRFGVRPDLRAFFRVPTLQEITRLLMDGAASVAGASAGGAAFGVGAGSSGGAAFARGAAWAAGVAASAAAGLSASSAIVVEAETPVWRGWEVLDDAEARATFRGARPQFPRAPERRVLPAVEPIAAAYEQRRSCRHFSGASVSIETVGRFLRCFQAVEAEVAGDRRARFLYPSAGGLYGVDVFFYAAPHRVEGLAGGLYYYHPVVHDLVEIVPDVALDVTVWHGTGNRPVTDSAAFILLFVTDPANSAPLYGGDDARWLNSVNSGYMGQLAIEHARQQGLGVCPLHGCHFDRIRWLFPYGERAALLHAIAGGYPAEGAAS